MFVDKSKLNCWLCKERSMWWIHKRRGLRIDWQSWLNSLILSLRLMLLGVVWRGGYWSWCQRGQLRMCMAVCPNKCQLKWIRLICCTAIRHWKGSFCQTGCNPKAHSSSYQQFTNWGNFSKSSWLQLSQNRSLLINSHRG